MSNPGAHGWFRHPEGYQPKDTDQIPTPPKGGSGVKEPAQPNIEELIKVAVEKAVREAEERIVKLIEDKMDRTYEQHLDSWHEVEGW